MKSAPALASVSVEEPLVSDRDLIISLLAQNVALRAELAHVRSLVPQGPPAGWKRVKELIATAHLSEQAIYKQAKQGRCASKKIRDCLWIDPTTVHRGRVGRRRAKV